MDKERIEELSNQFYKDLVEDTIPFWIEHGIDRENGGYTTYLDRKGNPLSTHKPMWVMGRFAWILSRLYNTLERRDQWLDLSKHGVDFIRKYGFDKDSRMFYIVEKNGRPIRKRRYLFTETFATIALAEYAKASRDKEIFNVAKNTMKMVLDYYKDPTRLEPKFIPENFSTKGHSMAMIQINTLQVLREAAIALNDTSDIPGHGGYNTLIDNAVEEVFSYFVKPERKVLLETVGPNGEYLGNIPEGRCINPGHAIETAWFVMEEGRYRKDEKLIKKALPILDWSLDCGWDKEFGGILYFIDAEGKTPVQLEWDMKLWWPHNEAIYGTLLAYYLTGEPRYEAWFEKLYDWSIKRFPDKEYGEWFGYLHRDGSLALDMKGNLFKGPFHLPRQQLFCHLLLQSMAAK